MNEYIANVIDELKRADHIIYVSLKYTRTGDVLKNAVERLINALDFCILALANKLINENKISEIPIQPVKKAEIVKEHFSDDEEYGEIISDFMDFYLLLRKINNAEFTSEREFRRHVAMIVEVDNKKIEINIDIITEYYHKIKELVDILKKIVPEND